MSQSEVARLRQQIVATCEAMYQAQHGYAVTSPHAIINAKYRQLEAQQTKLARLVGDNEALQAVCDAMSQAQTTIPCSSPTHQEC